MNFESKKLIVFVVFLITGTALYAQSAPASIFITPEYKVRKLPYGFKEYIPAEMPAVGLSLSGGGSRGIAQVGVLKALEEYQIPVNIIAGTSMGSIVGGLYALGYSVSELDSIAVSTDWNGLLSINTKINRKELFIDQKLTEDRSVFSLRLRGLNPVLPNAINDGQRLTNYLSLLTLQAPVRFQDKFDDLEIKFRAVCTDLVTGKAVALNRGSLAKAMRASSSVSFLLSPVQFDSLTLVDGGLVANIPVEITKREGADIVIAVNTTSELHDQEALTLPWNVADQIVSIPMKKLNESQLSRADNIITPALKGRLSTDFSNPDSIILSGYTAALSEIKDIKEKINGVFQKNVQKDDFIVHSPMLVSCPEGLNRHFDSLFSKGEIKKSSLLLELYAINADGEYSDLYAQITPYNNFSAVKIFGNPVQKVESVSYTGIQRINRDTVNRILIQTIGKSYGGRPLYEILKSVLLRYRSFGYTLAEIDSIFFDTDAGNLHIHFREGLIDSIAVAGNSYTNSTIIRREIPIRQGELLMNNSLRQSLTNLKSTNLFEDVVIGIESDQDKDILRFTVQEKNTSIARFGFKLDNENLPQASIDVRDENLFGTATELGLSSFVSPRMYNYSVEHKANQIFDTYLTYSIKGFYRSNNIYTYQESPDSRPTSYTKTISGEYNQRAFGFSAAIGSQVERLGNVIIRGTYEKDILDNTDKTPIKPESTRLVTIRASSTIDTQDKYPYPDNGVRITGYYEIASIKFGSEIGYTNIGGEYNVHASLSPSNTLSTGLKIGFSDKTLPLSQQYSIGGQYNFLGMRENEFRGRQVFVGSLEYRYRMPFKIFFDTYLHARYNLGSISEIPNELKISDFIHGAGFTMSFNTPVGPADFSVARAFTIVKDASPSLLRFGPVYFYFSIGYYY